MLALLLKPFERGLSPMQGGFREDRSTLDQAATLHQILSTRFNDAKPTIVAFLDIKSAYDCVNRRLLWACCEKACIPDPVIRMLSGMFDHNRSRVVVDGSEGEWFQCSVGVMQGSSLSPLLYALYIDELPITLHSKFSSLPLGTTSVNSILYADDIALVAESGSTMQSMLDYCVKFAKEREFEWGVQKCEVLLSHPPASHVSLSLQGEVLSVCNEFKYLGISFSKKGIDSDACVNRLGRSIEKAAMALAAMGLQPRNYPLHIIASHFRVFVRSCGEYSLAILPLNKTQMAKLEQSQYGAIKFLLKTKSSLIQCLEVSLDASSHSCFAD